MKVTLVPSSAPAPGEEPHQYLTTFLLNDTVAIDAGSLGLYRAPADQARVKHVLLTHSHIDHLATLPIFLENVYRDPGGCPTVYGTQEVLTALRQDLFNGRLWPDFVAISEKAPVPFLKLRLLEPGQPVECGGLRITAVPVNHLVPTVGLLVEDDQATVVFPSDTSSTDAIWELANAAPNLKAVFLEVTFPNEMAELADIAKHLTPALLAREVQKLRRPATVFAVHIKPRHRAQVLRELEALHLPNLRIGQPGRPYSFDDGSDNCARPDSLWARWLRAILPGRGAR